MPDASYHSDFQERTRSIVHPVICTVLSVIVCAGCSAPARSSQGSFEIAVDTPMAKSVKILDVESVTAADDIVYLHFTISSEDLARILSRGQWTRDQPSSVTFGGDKPAWWYPDTMGTGSWLYGCDRGKENWNRNLYVGPNSNEVYAFCYQFWR